jgi:hypothetical protein
MPNVRCGLYCQLRTKVDDQVCAPFRIPKPKLNLQTQFRLNRRLTISFDQGEVHVHIQLQVQFDILFIFEFNLKEDLSLVNQLAAVMARTGDKSDDGARNRKEHGENTCKELLLQNKAELVGT